MRIPNREINIFNMSMLDVICGALGAFLIVTVVLFPSYQNKATVIVEEVGRVKEENERLRGEIAKVRRAAVVPRGVTEMIRENARLQETLDALRQSQDSKLRPAEATVDRPSREAATNAPVRLMAAGSSSLTTATNPPLLVWVAWVRPRWTKHFSVALGLVPERPASAGLSTAEDIKRQFKRGKFGGSLQGASIVHHRAPRERDHTIFNEGVAYTLVGNPRPPKWYVIYVVSERSEFPNLGKMPEPVTVSGFAVYGNQEITLPKVSLLNSGSSVLVGSLSLAPNQGLRFEEIMERKAPYE